MKDKKPEHRCKKHSGWSRKTSDPLTVVARCPHCGEILEVRKVPNDPAKWEVSMGELGK